MKRSRCRAAAEVEVNRAGHGPTLVWLHGPHGVRRTDPIIAALAERYTVIAPVQPGYNDETELDDIRDVRDLALHYDDILEALGLDRVSLVGHSIGAMIAAELAAHVPRRVARLVLLAPLGLWRDDAPVEDLFARPYAKIDELLWTDGKVSGPMADPSNVPADPVERAVALARAMTSAAKFIWPIPDKGLGRRLHRISADTLAVFGGDDRLLPAAYAADFARIRGARTAIVRGCGHMFPYERLDETVSLIERHMAG